MDRFKRIQARIEEVISKSKVPEDLPHAHNTLKWLCYLKPDPDLAMKVAAFGHDIERAIEERKVHRSDFTNFDQFKKAHAENSALIIGEILSEIGVSTDLIERVVELVRRHEFGGDGDSDLLMYADSISFFDVNVNYYLKRHSWEDTRRRALWSYQKLPEPLRDLVERLDHRVRILVKS
ncbi:hypothetical protein DRP53_07735 [candidate division WOR-3 bacterium]|uniref:DUF4202 family protein n=1 Tax=candidate division WOR-3 bacterium TaxID=2052148 RepID=A0A660SHF7_UNCW3|nr:MAG: hypothetical protein DRP53_07735 [candidate division WOR-3 bacterium]